MKTTKVLGVKGEVLAKNYLLKHGYEIIEINYKNKIGEIDIIAKQGKTLVFVEVKARSSKSFGLPREAVNIYKQRKIRQVATAYLIKNNLYEKCNIRFDVIDVLGDEVAHIPNAF